MPSTNTDNGGDQNTLGTEDILNIWAKAVDTQMHFNEMSVKSRQLGLAFVAAALGVAIVLLGQGKAFYLHVPIGDSKLHFHVAGLIIIAAAAAMYAVRILDTGVYHMMLRGAVTFGEDFEGRHVRKLIGGEKGMTEAISYFSRYAEPKVQKCDHGYHYPEGKKGTALQKINKFYNVVIFVLVVAAVLTVTAAHFSYAKEASATPVGQEQDANAT